MSLSFMSFLITPEFVLAWYGLGLVFALLFLADIGTRNKELNLALKLAWPIILVFFSIFGYALYKLTCGSEKSVRGEEMPAYKRVVNSAIHCVAGDGIGIMTAMVISRFVGMAFWHEFWFEYAVGFASGWFVFQYIAMRRMADSPGEAMWMAGRAEFFSMITVMLGMGLVMALVTPALAGHPPLPNTAAFWGLGFLGLLAGFVLTYPMNYWMVKIGWKHGKCR